MVDNKLIVDKIVEGIQELKGKKIVVVDMTQLAERACDYFVICEGASSTHVASVSDSIRAYVKKELGINPYAVDGKENCLWVAFDYGQIFAHVFLPQEREFYDIEHLWADAKVNFIPDLD